MNDMSQTILARSDQINAVDLRARPRTVTIREVRIKAGDDQPVSVLIEGDNKAFRPCLGVRRLMVRVWGADANKYIGQSMTLFFDPSVTWAGKEEGGIRVSHMTGLDEQIVEYMRTSRTATKPYKILPLAEQKPTPQTRLTPEQWAADHIAFVVGAADVGRLNAVRVSGEKAMTKLAITNPPLHVQITAAYAKRFNELSPMDGDPFEPEGKPDADRGEGFTDPE